jgi:hypothetical protein
MDRVRQTSQAIRVTDRVVRVELIRKPHYGGLRAQFSFIRATFRVAIDLQVTRAHSHGVPANRHLVQDLPPKLRQPGSKFCRFPIDPGQNGLMTRFTITSD